MSKYALRIDHSAYDVHTTDEFDTSITETYKRFLKEQPEGFADKWLNKITAFISGLAVPAALGKIDTEKFSDTYAHHQIKDTQTAVFLLVEGDQIYLVTSGWSGSNWPEILKSKKTEITRQLDTLKHRALAAKATRQQAPANPPPAGGKDDPGREDR